MRHPSFSSTTPTTMSSSIAAAGKSRKGSNSSSLHNNNQSSSLFCSHHSPSATGTLDLLILILVLISGTFLLTSYLSYVFTSLSLLLSPHLPAIPPLSYAVGALVSFSALSFFALCRVASGFRVHKCGNPNCKGLKKALEFDLQLQTEDSLKNNTPLVSPAKPNNKINHNNNQTQMQVIDIDKLPWKGGTENNPDYECLRSELRKMAPPNGRAVLLFRAKCGCPVAKLIGWAPKKARKHKKTLSSTMVNSDHR